MLAGDVSESMVAGFITVAGIDVVITKCNNINVEFPNTLRPFCLICLYVKTSLLGCRHAKSRDRRDRRSGNFSDSGEIWRKK